ncbi:OLC1v1011338C1 [Oldenlandia corymbosa var. corymbosa]|uniref:OLC1v1011338C1 n=1 Tax=Oldenlandia corymbosa var. corymbosa TaxID=529605 RepID=A0AAV1DV47_OLDCO|nr:OLC1v1011338C1 [Oldenlandia corymbosa var. corymbosa]
MPCILNFTIHDKGRPLPKFGEWDVNNPASADGFTVIFAKARDEKKATGTAAGAPGQKNYDNNPPRRTDARAEQQHPPSPTKTSGNAFEAMNIMLCGEVES